MLGKEYKQGTYTKDYIKSLLTELTSLGCEKIVLTGVWFDNDKLGAACYDKVTKTVEYAFNNRIDGSYHGTGDVFASALLAGLLNNFTLIESTQIAVDFTYSAILKTAKAHTDTRFGVNFENIIPKLINDLNLI